MNQLKLVWDSQDPANKDRANKLTTDKVKILHLLQNGNCWLVSDLARCINNPSETSVSANVRNLRKDGYEIKLIRFGKGLNGYQMVGVE